MSILQRVARGAERTWAAYPLIGIVLLFAAIGLGVFYGYQARILAGRASTYARQAHEAVVGQVAAKDAVIAAKEAQIAEKDREIQQRDTAIAGQVSVIGQIYNAAIALQQQVLALGGKPKTIPVMLPSRPTPTPTSPRNPVPSPAASPAVDWHLTVQCLVICP